jgi:hypothetical protein
MKTFATLLLSFILLNTSHAKCQKTGAWEPFRINKTTPRFWNVEVNTDCIYETGYGRGFAFVSGVVLVRPKSGQAGVNEKRILYVPNKNFTGKDFMRVKIKMNQLGVVGDAILDIHYTVK